MSKKLNWFEYYIGHCLQTGWREIWNNFKMWRDLVSGNYSGYALMPDDDPYEECYNWFWTSINLDETYPKEFLEYLHQLMDDVDTGKVETVPMTLEELNRISDLLDREEEEWE